MGAGFSLDAVNIVRANRALLKKRKFKDIKQLLLETSGKTKLEFKKITPKEMAIIKEKIRIQSNKDMKLGIVNYIIASIVVGLILYGIWLWMNN